MNPLDLVDQEILQTMMLIQFMFDTQMELKESDPAQYHNNKRSLQLYDERLLVLNNQKYNHLKVLMP